MPNKRDRRDKASDIFNRSTPVFAQKVPFAQAFPQVEHITVRVTENDMVNDVHTIIFDERNMREFVDCTNWVCFNGGFRLGNLVGELVRDGATEGSKSGLCQGYEGSPKGRRKYRKCLHGFKVEVRIVYKEPAESEDGSNESTPTQPGDA